MSDSKLRSSLIRLAHANPELRGELLPLMKTASMIHKKITILVSYDEDQPVPTDADLKKSVATAIGKGLLDGGEEPQIEDWKVSVEDRH